MSKSFFSRFPKVSYNIDGKGSLLNLTNIVNNVNIDLSYLNESTYYTFYEITDGERPDTVSYELYETPDYYWTLFIINNNLRNGLSDSWPLSNQQFDRMLSDEYEKYSSITFMPVTESNNGKVLSGLFNLTSLSSKYLPYLKLTDEGCIYKAKILKYDNHTLQLVIYDIRRIDNNSLVSNIQSFIKGNSYYKLMWDNPFESESDEYDECEELRKEFVNFHIDIYSQIDPNVIPDHDFGDSIDEVDESVFNALSNYVFSKQFLAAPIVLRWENYVNAASVFYIEDLDGNRITTAAYDVVINSNNIFPKFSMAL
jgi:hypothetical protein